MHADDVRDAALPGLCGGRGGAQGEKIPFDYVDITESTANLKAFLKLRDESPLFDEVKAAGGIGIPCFILPGGRMTLDVQEALSL